MQRILVPSAGATCWRRFLADPDNQWKRGASALELAVSWESAQKSERGIPPAVAAVLDQNPVLAGTRLLVALPEHRVALKGRGKASQTDVWTLLRASDEYVSMAVEGKAGELFASTLGEWLIDASRGKRDRLEHLCNILQVTTSPGSELRYQLFHRTASAILEAQRFGAKIAVMLVQAFSTESSASGQSWQDFTAYCALLGATAARGKLMEAPRASGTERLFLGWVDCPTASDSEIAMVV